MRPTLFGTLAGGGTPLDPDAQAFITAAGITDPTQITAINDLVLALKADSIWSKFVAIYPMVGGTANSTKYNLKDPRDLDAAFRIVWNGTNSFASTGVTSNGSTGYGDTKFVPSVNGTNNSTHISFYSRINSTAGNYAMGGGIVLDPNCVGISPTGLAGPSNGIFELYGSGFVNTFVADTRGLFTASRTSSTVLKGFFNGSVLATQTAVSAGISGATDSLFLLAKNSVGSAGSFTPLECAWGSIGTGLSDADVAALYVNVQAFQVALSRQV